MEQIIKKIESLKIGESFDLGMGFEIRYDGINFCFYDEDICKEKANSVSLLQGDFKIILNEYLRQNNF